MRSIVGDLVEGSPSRGIGIFPAIEKPSLTGAMLSANLHFLVIGWYVVFDYFLDLQLWPKLMVAGQCIESASRRQLYS